MITNLNGLTRADQLAAAVKRGICENDVLTACPTQAYLIQIADMTRPRPPSRTLHPPLAPTFRQYLR